MSKTFTSPFAQNGRPVYATVTVATPLTGANSIGTDTPVCTYLGTAGPEGALLTRLFAMPRGTVTATGLQLYSRKASDPAGTRHLKDSELMPAYSMTATTLIPETNFANYNEGTPGRLEGGEELYVGTALALAAGIKFTAELVDF